MKKKTLLLLFCAISVAALYVEEGDPSLKVGSAASGIAFILPQPQTDFSDLDVRDNQNHVILSPSASQQLEALFRENLIHLQIFSGFHSVAKDITWLNSLSHLFNGLILSRIYAAVELFQDAYLPAFRRFVHNVNNLCVSFIVGAFAACLLLSSFSLSRNPRRVYLRC